MMNGTRTTILAALVLLVGCAACGTPEDLTRPGGDAAAPPNVVLIMADDLGAECVECYGGTSYPTPHLDAMARSGVRFTNAYATPLCTPTRVQLMTGQYPFRNGWTGGIWTKPVEEQAIDPDGYNFAHLMQRAGYATAVAGKWQLGRFDRWPQHARDVGFDEHCLWTWRYEGVPDDVRMEGGGRPSRYWSPAVWKNGSLMDDTAGRFGPDIYADFVIDFMERHRDEPFFVYYPMALPHFPFVPLPGEEGDRGGTMEPPKAQAYFAGMVAYTDTLVGRVLEAVDRLGLGDNTLVLFTGDNGTDTRQASRVDGRVLEGDKGRLTEAGARVPLIARWPGTVPAGRVRDDLVDLSDVLPTLADLAGAAVPETHAVDGVSFLPQLRGEDGDPRDWVFVQLGDDWYVRGPRWRLRRNGELADLSDRYAPRVVDPGSDPAAAAAKRRLEEAAASLMGRDAAAR